MRIAVLFGGRSAEHEVSLQSARNVVRALDRKKYDVLLIGIDKTGRWKYIDDPKFLDKYESMDPSELLDAVDTVSIPPYRLEDEPLYLKEDAGEHGTRSRDPKERMITSASQEKRGSRGDALSAKQRQVRRSIGPIDVIFPVLHGSFGEDGTIQGLLKLADVPFVGAGVLGSAVSMDKDIMKRLLRDSSVPVPRFLVYDWTQRKKIDFDAVTTLLGLPFFVKPANLGSSVGVNKVKKREELSSSVDEAFEYDNKILIEEYIEAREIECSVLGNENPIASVPGEVKPTHEFYSYEAKYIDEKGARLEIPAKIDEETKERIQKLAVKAFKILSCEGMARVDFFLKESKKVVLNEVNTIPGFTVISMYPKLWEASGLSQTELVDRLVELAIERFQREKKLKRFYTQ